MEATGGHQQFYDKFSMRRHAINVLRYLWKNPIHRETFQKDAMSVHRQRISVPPFDPH